MSARTTPVMDPEARYRPERRIGVAALRILFALLGLFWLMLGPWEDITVLDTLFTMFLTLPLLAAALVGLGTRARSVLFTITFADAAFGLLLLVSWIASH